MSAVEKKKLGPVVGKADFEERIRATQSALDKLSRGPLEEGFAAEGLNEKE